MESGFLMRKSEKKDLITKGFVLTILRLTLLESSYNFIHRLTEREFSENCWNIFFLIRRIFRTHLKYSIVQYAHSCSCKFSRKQNVSLQYLHKNIKFLKTTGILHFNFNFNQKRKKMILLKIMLSNKKLHFTRFQCVKFGSESTGV